MRPHRKIKQRKFQKSFMSTTLDNRILIKAENLFLRYGIKSVSMDDIARELGISKKTLYQSVENKKDLLMQVIQAHVTAELEAMSTIQAEAADAIDEMLRVTQYALPTLRQMSPTVIYDMQKYYQEVWQMIEGYHNEHIFDMIKANLERGISEGVYRDDFNADIVAKLYVGKTMLVIDEGLFPLKNYNKENLFKEYIKYHIRGIASAKGLKLLEKHFKKLI